MRLRADLAGILDFPAERATVDASLHDSGVLGIFTVYGDLAFAACWGSSPYTVLSLGGFYPGFRPEPAQIRPLSRLGMSLDNPLPGLRLRAEGYLAATSNTLQLGGRLDLGIDAGIASVSGFLGVDAIIQFSPFHFNANTTGGLDVKFLGETFAGIRFDGAMSGPGPVTLHGKITVETFIKDFEWEDTFVFGEPDSPPGIPPQRAAQILVDEEFRPANVRAVGGADPSVMLSTPDRQNDFAVVAPLSGLSWSQHRVPFDLALDRVDGTPLQATQTLHASAPGQSGVEKDRFSPGSYITLTQAQALASPTYDLLPSGIAVGAGALLNGATAPGSDKPQLLRKVRDEGLPIELLVAVGLQAAFPGGLLDMLQDRDRRSFVADSDARVTATDSVWVTTTDGAAHEFGHPGNPGRHACRRRRADGGRRRSPDRDSRFVEMTETFVAWRRPAITDLATAGTFAAGRLVGRLKVTLADEGGALEGNADFLFAGPADVRGLQAGVVIGRKPAPGTLDAEVTRVAHIELGDPGLPWRYSPVPNAPAGVRPWIVLVVGIAGEEIFIENGRARILKAALGEHPLDHSAAWAHVHDLPGRSIARILSPRALPQGKALTAVLVPAYLPGDGAAGPRAAWDAVVAEVTLPCFDAWHFHTIDEDDDFQTIAGRLGPLSTDETIALGEAGFGLAQITPVAGAASPLRLHGALGVVPQPGDPPLDELPDTVADQVEGLAELTEMAGRWVLGLPRYDEPWTAPGAAVPGAGWRRQLRVDPRARGSAGLGAWAAIAWQDRISDGASRQAGALALLAERVRHLSLGLRGTRSQWTRRLPLDPVTALTVVAPMLARIPSGGATVADFLVGRTSRLVSALFSSAARRMLRPRTALQRVAAPGATSLAALFEAAATRCAPRPEPLPGQKDLPKLVGDPENRRRARERLAGEGSAFLEAALGQMHEGTVEDVRGLGGLLEGLGESLIARLARPERPEECFPIADLGVVAGSILDGISPMVDRPLVVARVLDSFSGVRQPELAAPDLALELNIPLWSFLKEEAPDWLLPGAGSVPDDRVLALQTNPDFVDALLIGANHRALGELRWRNFPIVVGWTPLRRFWQRIDDTGIGPAVDIRPVLDILTPPSPGAAIWTDDSMLGAASHQRDGAGPRLVILLHTELFRRYPTTLVYLLPNPGGTATWQHDVEAIATVPVWPNFSGALNPELVYFGFPLPPEGASDHWLVLEEPPPGYRFKMPTAAQQGITNAADYAKETLHHPVRAFFGKLL